MKSKPVSPIGSEQPRFRLAWWTWFLLGLGGLFLFLTLLLSLLIGPPSAWLPAHIHSVLSADYSQDARGVQIAQLKFSVIRDILSDFTARRNQAGGADPDVRFAEVLNEMQTPVPTVTPMPGSTVFVPTANPTLTATPPIVTDQVVTEPAATPSPTHTSSPTSTGTAFLTPGPSPTATRISGQATATRKPPTQGPAATKTSGPATTKTSGPAATNTPRPTQPPATTTPRPTQPPTATHRPPTATQKPPTNPPYPPPTPYP